MFMEIGRQLLGGNIVRFLVITAAFDKEKLYRIKQSEFRELKCNE